MEPASKEALYGQLGSMELKNILCNYSKGLDEFAESINIYESLSAVLMEFKIHELSNLSCQEIENALRKLPKPPSFELRNQIFDSIQKANEEISDKIQAAQQKYESELKYLNSRLKFAVLNMVHGIVSGEREEKTAEILYSEKIQLPISMRGLDRKHKKLVQKMLEEDTAELLSAMTLVEEALTTYRNEMNNHFHSYRWMSSELFSTLHKQAEMTARAKFKSDSSPFFVELTNGLNQMHNIFSGMNEHIEKSENNLVLEMNQREPRIVNMYREMMKNEKQEGYETPQHQLRQVKEDIKFVEGVKKRSIANLMAAATKVVYYQRRIYNCKMEKCLKKAGGMMDPLQLKEHHDSYSTDAGNTVLFKVKKMEGLCTSLNYVEILQKMIEPDWIEFKNENAKKLRQKEKMEREVAGNQKSENEVLGENVLETQNQPKPHMNVPQFNGNSLPTFTPLFQFGSSSKGKKAARRFRRMNVESTSFQLPV